MYKVKKNYFSTTLKALIPRLEFEPLGVCKGLSSRLLIDGHAVQLCMFVRGKERGEER